ncbi:FAD-binding protein [Micrococcales bacterium 31B]|nr:FAD-binding protein [Micrococcales bacterium 31B]
MRDLAEFWRTDDATRSECAVDRSGQTAASLPDAVAQPVSTEEVAAVLRRASETGLKIVPRGSGTGLAGAAIAAAGEVVLDLRGLNAIEEVDEANQVAVVQAGVINGDLDKHLEPAGLWWASDPASADISTVGGNIATNAGGLLCAKYGSTKQSVLGLEVVLPSGDVIRTGSRTMKGVSGLDVTALMCGSEGLLGVITRATLKLTPLWQGAVFTIGAYFTDVVAACGGISRIAAAKLRPAMCELLDERSLSYICEYTGRDLMARGPVYVLVQTDGPAAEAEAAAIAEILRSQGGDVSLTGDPAEGDDLVAVRRQMHFALSAVAPALIEDVCVPRSALPEMFAFIQQTEREFGLDIPTLAHAGDGNLHPNFFVEPDGTVPQNVWDAADHLFEHALTLGGTLTGEHGVGVLKRASLPRELGEVQMDLQRRIKAAFDPQGLLNPGKVL